MLDDVKGYSENTHRGNEPEQENRKTHNELIASLQLLVFPALPLSDGGGDEDHDERSIE